MTVDAVIELDEAIELIQKAKCSIITQNNIVNQDCYLISEYGWTLSGFMV
jgi:hypothetical protein